MAFLISSIKKQWIKTPLVSRLWVGGLLLLFFLAESKKIVGNQKGQDVRLIVAKRQLQPGMILSMHDLTVKLTNQSDKNRQSAFTDSDIHELTGKKLLFPVQKGEAILDYQITFPENIRFSTKVPKGSRAFSISLDDQIPLEPGDYIDLYHDFTKGNQLTSITLQNKKVLALRNKSQGQELLIALEDSEIEKIIKLEEKPNWQVFMRNPSDPQKKKAVTPPQSNRPRKKIIEILSETSR